MEQAKKLKWKAPSYIQKIIMPIKWPFNKIKTIKVRIQKVGLGGEDDIIKLLIMVHIICYQCIQFIKLWIIHKISDIYIYILPKKTQKKKKKILLIWYFRQGTYF